ncbi:hypothetical protein [Janthinobacterium sp. CG3]|uniref:hypothetical protein n=1 Tax=Janthinobacterium sp. CG3 TaxID=1075768 RepID=UPI0012FA7C8B|nr:hypothetical protein [Janthinobacterium sp. CG3]
MIFISNLGGMIPRLNAAMLPDTAAQLALNCTLWNGDLRPLKSPLAVVTPGALGGAIKSIYRIGMALPETQYWMAWTTDVDVVRGMIAGDTSERTYFTGNGVPKVTNLQMATQGGTSYPVNSYALGVPAPAAAPICVPNASTAPAETRVYIFTYVSAWGEEGAPSPPRSVAVTEGGSVQLTALATAPGGNYNLVSKRIYRSQQVAGGAPIYQFVAEIANATTSYNDTLKSTQLGEELSTLHYAMPPASLTGLVALPNGIMAGFSGSDLYFCEPYLPYAWPEKYRLTTDFQIVGLGVFGSSLLVCTKGSPYLVTGVHPDGMSMERIELDQSCVSKRSIVSVGGGVMYASPDGLLYVGAGGSRVVTAGLYTRAEWQALDPSTINGYFYDGKYIALYAGGGFILNSIEDTSLTKFDEAVTAGYSDPINDALYLSIGGSIRKFNAGADKTYTWRSKKFQRFARPMYACARVDADSYPVTLNIYADGVLKHTKAVADEDIFRIPGGYRPREVEIELTGTARVRMVGLADNPKELKIG